MEIRDKIIEQRGTVQAAANQLYSWTQEGKFWIQSKHGFVYVCFIPSHNRIYFWPKIFKNVSIPSCPSIVHSGSKCYTLSFTLPTCSSTFFSNPFQRTQQGWYVVSTSQPTTNLFPNSFADRTRKKCVMLPPRFANKKSTFDPSLSAIICFSFAIWPKLLVKG